MKTLIINDNTNLHRVEGKCKRCQHMQEEILERQDVIPKKTAYVNNPCPSCKSMEVEANEHDIVDYLQLLASKTGSQVRR